MSGIKASRLYFILIFVTVYIFIFPLCAYSQTEIRCESFIYNTDTYDLRLSIYNSGSEDTKNTYLFCAYDDNGKMLALKKEAFNMTASSRAIKNISFNNAEEISYAKVFAVNDMRGLKLDDEKTIEKDCRLVKLWNFADKSLSSIGEITEPITADGLTFNYSNKYMECQSNGRLYLYGGGNKADCSVSFHTDGKCRINVTAASVNEDMRTLVIADGSGSALKEFSVGEKTKCSYEYNGGDIYIFSKSSGIYIYSIELDYNDAEPKEAADIYVDKSEDIDLALDEIECNGGGTLYLQGDYFPRSAPITLSRENSNVTIASADENTAVIDFSPYREGYFNTPKGVSYPGITIKGSGYSLKNIIVEKAPGNGINLNTENSHSNTMENVISRYNNGSGFSLSTGAHNNTFKYCSAYRNCDLYTRGENADGFHIGINAGAENSLYNCRSWDNADDGYDNFANYNDVSYINCYAFNNGNADVFTGKYDFDNGRDADRSLAIVELINSQTDSFEKNLSNGIFKLPDNVYITVKPDEGDEDINISASEFSGEYWCGNGNGFKLGSGDSLHGPVTDSQAYRLIENCAAFKNLSKGFDRNNGTETVSVSGFLSFDNTGVNYWSNLLNVEKAENIISFNGGKTDITDDSFVIGTVSGERQSKIRSYVYQAEDELRKACDENRLLGEFIMTPEI